MGPIEDPVPANRIENEDSVRDAYWPPKSNLCEEGVDLGRPVPALEARDALALPERKVAVLRGRRGTLATTAARGARGLAVTRLPSIGGLEVCDVNVVRRCWGSRSSNPESTSRSSYRSSCRQRSSRLSML